MSPQNFLHEITCTPRQKTQVPQNQARSKLYSLTTKTDQFSIYSRLAGNDGRVIWQRPRGSNEHSEVYLLGPGELDEVPKRT